jgi:nucleoside phosphorylase
VELAAAKAMLDDIHPSLPLDPNVNDTNCYVLGSLGGHNVVLASPPSGVYGSTSVAAVATQMLETFKFIRFSLMVGIGGGAPSTKNNIILGDIVVSKPTATRPGLMVYDFQNSTPDQFTGTKALNKPSNVLLTAAGKAETNSILGESQIPRYISKVVLADPTTFAHPGPDEDVLFDSDYDHITTEFAENGCDRCDPNRIRGRPPRETQDPKVHYGLIASANQWMSSRATMEKLAREHGILCFETEAAGFMDTDQCLVIRGICDYADSHSTKLWHGYAAAAAAAYAKEILLLIPTASKAATLTVTLTADILASAAIVLDALLLTRPEIDRSSLISLKGRRADGTCNWVVQHTSYQKWLVGGGPSLLWISGGPGKGKTMMSIYLTEVLQPMVDSNDGVLLYYFISNRDRNRNTALTIMRGILHQWLSFHPHLAQHIKTYFEGSETTKYTISSFVSLWRLFLIMLSQSGTCQVVCILDGLDECEKKSLKQLLDALGDYISKAEETPRPKLKLICLSRPQPVLLENKLGRYCRIKLDESERETRKDVEKYIFAEVAELASEQTLSEDNLLEVQQALQAGAEGTFLWVGFVADELKGRNWAKIQEILHGVPKGLGGVYQRLLQLVEDKKKLVSMLQWIVLAARPLTVDELTVVTKTKASGDLMPTDVMRDQLASCGLLVKINGDVVNLVHESAKEFFQSSQVNIQGINMFYMDQTTHLALMQTCLTLIEESYKPPNSISNACLNNTLLAYACLYWPEHFRHAFEVMDDSHFSRPFFLPQSPVREDWWEYYWEQEKYGGVAPTFTLLHLAAYFGNVGWTKMLLKQYRADHVTFRRLTGQKDNYGRTPLFWAATRGHKDVVEFLISRGASINAKDRSGLTALHIAVTSDHKDVVDVLLDSGARIEGKATYGDTPLIRAIQANSEETIKVLLEHGARVDELPTPHGVTSLKGPREPVDERVRELLGLQEQLFTRRYADSSRSVAIMLNALTASFYFPPILNMVSLYLKHSSFGRWEVMHVLQDLVKNNKEAKLRQWGESYLKYGKWLIKSRRGKSLARVTGLSAEVYEMSSTGDLQALLVIGLLIGAESAYIAAYSHWREGRDILTGIFAAWASTAYRRDAGEYLHKGLSFYLKDFDNSIRSGRSAENIARTETLFAAQVSVLKTKDPKPIEYFATLNAEYYEGYIGSSYEEQLFSDVNQAVANELIAFSKGQDSATLHLYLTALFQFAGHAKDKGLDAFFNMPPAAYLIICQKDPEAHQWLLAEAVPETMSILISELEQGPLQKRAYKALVECLIIGKQYDVPMRVTLHQTMKQHLGPIAGADGMLDQMLTPTISRKVTP